MPKFNQEDHTNQKKYNKGKYNSVELVKEERRDHHHEVNHQYNEEGLMYSNELFNKALHKLICAMAKEAYNRESIAFVKRYPIIKMLTFLSKKLFLNGLELVFMQYILQENKWDIHDQSILRSAPSLKDFMNSTDVGDEQQYKCFLLYLTLIGYSAKYYLNDTERIEMFGRELNSIIPDFASIFKEWSKRNSAVTSKISPKVLNAIFRKLNSKDDKINYLMMVQEIIHISPPYNNNQNEKKQKIKKQRVQASSRPMKQAEDSESKHFQSQQRIEANIGLGEQQEQLPQQPPFYRQGTSMDGVHDMIDKNLHNFG